MVSTDGDRDKADQAGTRGRPIGPGPTPQGEDPARAQAQLLIGLMSVLAGAAVIVLLVVSNPVSVKITVYAP
jgi:hypothetical protein